MTPALAFTTARLLRPGMPLVLCLALGAAAPAPPPGHPSPGQAMEMMAPDQPASKELRHEGKVLRTLDANEFTYVEVNRAGALEWLAAPLMPIKPGSTVRFEEGSVMTNFHSKLLERTFSSVRFVGAIAVAAEP